MSINFNDIKADFKSVQEYLKNKNIELSNDETKALSSIFTEADKAVYKENEKGYNDQQLDMREQKVFIQNIEHFRDEIKKSIQDFFISVTRRQQERQAIRPAVPDALRVDKSAEKFQPKTEILTSTDTSSTTPQIINQKFNKNHPITQTEPILYDTEIMNQALNNIIGNNSKLKNTAKHFINYAKDSKFQYNLDPIFIIAISLHESARGHSKPAQNKNNVGGIMGKNGLRKFNTVEECIDSISRTINTRVKEGYNTIGKVGKSGRYCDKSASENWIKNVVFFAEKVRNEYNKLLQEKYQK